MKIEKTVSATLTLSHDELYTLIFVLGEICDQDYKDEDLKHLAETGTTMYGELHDAFGSPS